MCATVDDSEVISVPFVDRRIVTPFRWRCRLSAMRHSEWVITGGHVVNQDRHAEKAPCCVMKKARICLTLWQFAAQWLLYAALQHSGNAIGAHGMMMSAISLDCNTYHNSKCVIFQERLLRF